MIDALAQKDLVEAEMARYSLFLDMQGGRVDAQSYDSLKSHVDLTMPIWYALRMLREERDVLAKSKVVTE